MKTPANLKKLNKAQMAQGMARMKNQAMRFKAAGDKFAGKLIGKAAAVVAGGGTGLWMGAAQAKADHLAQDPENLRDPAKPELGLKSDKDPTTWFGLPADGVVAGVVTLASFANLGGDKAEAGIDSTADALVGAATFRLAYEGNRARTAEALSAAE